MKPGLTDHIFNPSTWGLSQVQGHFLILSELQGCQAYRSQRSPFSPPQKKEVADIQEIYLHMNFALTCMKENYCVFSLV